MKVAQSCLTFYNPMDYTVHGILQARILEWVQFSSVAQSCLTLCDPMNCSTPGLPVHHQLPEFTQIQVHRVHDAIQPSHPLSSPSPPASNSFQHQSLTQWVNSCMRWPKYWSCSSQMPLLSLKLDSTFIFLLPCQSVFKITSVSLNYQIMLTILP